MEHEAAEVAEAAGSGMPQLDISIFPNLIFWSVTALVVLYLILTRVALPRIGLVLAERSDQIANDIEEAALLKRRAEAAEVAYGAALARARDEAQKIATETKAQINKDLAGLLARADAEIAAKSAESEKRIREIEQSATASIETVARETAEAIVKAFVPGAWQEGAATSAVAERMRDMR